MRVGIIGGGQLGYMLIKYGLRKLDQNVKITVLDPAGDQCCCAQLAGVEIIQGDLYSSEKLTDLGGCDVVTAEIEHFNAKVFTTCNWLVPSYVAFDTIGNKAKQKKFLASNNIPVVDHVLWNCQEPWTFTKTGRYVVKCTTGGYDGRGVFFIDNPTPDTMLCNANGLTLFQLADKMPDKTVIVEEFISPTEHLEISVIVAVDDHSVVYYEPVVMKFHSERNILDYVTSSTGGLSRVDHDKLIKVATETARLFGKGLFAVEMFYNHYRKYVLVNEVAPRVHNSGHHTIESHDISQFEMCARILLNVPIVQPKQLYPFFEMSNVLGTFDDSPYVISLHTGIPPHNVFVHDYGKKVSKKWRKLGHITSVSNDLTRATTVNIAKVIKPDDRPVIGVIMGSETDYAIMRKASDLLSFLDVPFEETVVSAHRTPERLREYAQTALARGLQVVIAGAGGAAHLPGMTAAFAPGLPVIGVPLNRNSLNGQDALMSIVQMPSGVPVACMAIDGAANAALFATMMIPAYRDRAIKHQTEAQANVESKLAKGFTK